MEIWAQGAEKVNRKYDSFLSESRIFEIVFTSWKHFKDLFLSRSEQANAWSAVKMDCKKKLLCLWPAQTGVAPLLLPGDSCRLHTHQQSFTHTSSSFPPSLVVPHVFMRGCADKPVACAGSGRETCRAPWCWAWGQRGQLRTASSAAQAGWHFLCAPGGAEWFDGPFSSKALPSLQFWQTVMRVAMRIQEKTRDFAKGSQILRADSQLQEPGAHSVGRLLHCAQCKVLLFNATFSIAWQFPRGQTGLQTTCCVIIRSHVPEKAHCTLPLFIKTIKPHTRRNKNKTILSWVASDVHWMQLKLAVGQSSLHAGQGWEHNPVGSKKVWPLIAFWSVALQQWPSQFWGLR